MLSPSTTNPARARELFALAQHDVTERRRYYEQLAGVERALARPGTGDDADTDGFEED